MRKFVPLFMCALFVFGLTCVAVASGSSHNIPWGANVSEFHNLTMTKEADGIKYYDVKNEKVCEISDLATAKITYGFKNDKLYARIIDINNPQDFDKVHSHFFKTFGEAKVKQEGDWAIYKWSVNDVDIKLKENKKANRVKFGMYNQKL
ncbi:MAG: hypothetical protein BA863_10475 [Desulfovibrio sp. S3730MH75]|nr:MAG: hypothetical protein BA863_10475 [Desulfovibrio sp. S3730MH75]